ncbi:glycosyltransferase [Ottowia sp.]|uniref:glycosyltransferase n=1 Tax=Ottowia sp. TaxID=1898956 RepID=UPI0025E7F36D|nr:glycosyltransferase [Ottowia sp.]MBK6615775.1 hypothetical protein [Ottowia sp.]MBK6746822.1 hypothetical protein [Ottowia sp.]
MAPLVVVSATRLPEDHFWRQSALGVSLSRLRFDQALQPRIAFANARGLPTLYNQVIDAAPPGSLMVFVHDDVWLEDAFLRQRIGDGLERFDVIGVAGNRRRLPNQPGWCFADVVDGKLKMDERAHLSGSVAHGKLPFGPISHFGPSPAECELLDGLLLAARRDTLVARDVRFDERFLFHFYDLDFCRTARARGLKLGTWPLAVTHQSGGAFGSPGWKSAYQTYLAKWETSRKPA